MPVRAEIVAEDGAGWLRLDGALSDEQVGRLVELWLGEAAPARESVERILRAEERSVFGGARLTDTVTGVQVLPGCCLLLEDWRTWVGVEHRGTPDLGHDGPWPEFDDAGLTIWPSGDEDWRTEAVPEGSRSASSAPRSHCSVGRCSRTSSASSSLSPAGAPPTAPT
jgi:hypothetical protein